MNATKVNPLETLMLRGQLNTKWSQNPFIFKCDVCFKKSETKISKT